MPRIEDRYDVLVGDEIRMVMRGDPPAVHGRLVRRRRRYRRVLRVRTRTALKWWLFAVALGFAVGALCSRFGGW